MAVAPPSTEVARLHHPHLLPASRFTAARFHPVPCLSRLLPASVLILSVGIGAVGLLGWPGQVAPAIDVLFQPLMVLFEAMLLLALAAVLRAVVGLLLEPPRCWAWKP